MNARADEYVELKRQEVEFWRGAAARRRAEGQLATATTFDNLAWLLEHNESWLASQREGR